MDVDIIDTSTPRSLAELRADVAFTNDEYTPCGTSLTMWVNFKPPTDIRSPALRRLAEHAELLGMRVSACDATPIDMERLEAVANATDRLAAWRRRVLNA